MACLACCSLAGVPAKHAVSIGANSCTCCARSETLLRAAKATIRKCSGKHRTTSSVCRPIEPVLPSRAIRLGKSVIYLYPSLVKPGFTPIFMGEHAAHPCLFALIGLLLLSITSFTINSILPRDEIKKKHPEPCYHYFWYLPQPLSL